MREPPYRVRSWLRRKSPRPAPRQHGNARLLPGRVTDAYGGAAVHDDGYGYDADGDVSAITDYTAGNVGNRNMTYDNLDRLTEADSPMTKPSAGPLGNFRFWYINGRAYARDLGRGGAGEFNGWFYRREGLAFRLSLCAFRCAATCARLSALRTRSLGRPPLRANTPHRMSSISSVECA